VEHLSINHMIRTCEVSQTIDNEHLYAVIDGMLKTNDYYITVSHISGKELYQTHLPHLLI